jgi:hypothetical protein
MEKTTPSSKDIEMAKKCMDRLVEPYLRNKFMGTMFSSKEVFPFS